MIEIICLNICAIACTCLLVVFCVFCILCMGYFIYNYILDI